MKLHAPSALIIILTFLLSACQVGQMESDIDAAQVSAVFTPFDQHNTPTLPPTTFATETRSFTPAPTKADTSTPTISPSITPTPFFGFENARVWHAFARQEETVFYFIVPGVAATYYGTVDGFELTCETDSEQENLLVCRAEQNLFGTNLKAFEFFADQTKTFLVYEGSFTTELDKILPTPTPPGFIWPRADYTVADITWGYTPADCPARGINLTCEIEYRRYDDGSCLVGMSCYDSCGFYYSVDTIKNKPAPHTFSGPCW
jgi:hypothetical protein